MSKQEKVEDRACQIEEVKEVLQNIQSTLLKLQQFQEKLRDYLDKQQPKK